MELALIAEARPFITLVNLSSGSRKKDKQSLVPVSAQTYVPRQQFIRPAALPGSTAETLELQLPLWRLSGRRAPSEHLRGWG